MKVDQFAVNTIFLTLSRGLSLGGRAIVLLVLASTASRASLATSAIIVTMAETARFIGDFGAETWLIRMMGLAKNPSDAKQAGRTALWLRSVTSAAAAITVWFLSTGLHLLPPEATVIASVLAITGLMAGVPLAVLQARLQMPRLFRSQIPILMAGLTTAAFAARHHASAEATLSLLAIAECLAVCATLFQSDLLKSPSQPVGLSDIGDVARDCMPLALFNGLVGAYSRLDIWFLAWMSAASLPVYTVAFRLYQPWGLLTASMAGVAYAGMARSMGPEPYPGTFPTRKQIVAGILGAAALILSLLGMGIVVIGKLLPKYRDAIFVLEILSPLVPIMGFNGLCTAVLAVKGRFATLCQVAILNLVLFTVLLFVLIPLRGAAGAALALLIGETGNALMQAWLLRPRFRQHPIKIDGLIR